MTEPRRRSGPVPRISRDAVLQAARELPPEEMTLAAISNRLGVTGPALYRYFPDRTAIFEALADEAREKLIPPDPKLPWEQWLVEAARAERALWQTHANLYEVANYRAISRPTMRMMHVGIQVMTAAGFSTVDAVCGLTTITELAHAVGYAEHHAALVIDPVGADELQALLRRGETSITPDLVFERSVDITIGGLRSLLSPAVSRRRDH